MDWRVILTTFGAVFLAEMGDKTQLAAMTMAAQTKRPWAVFIGASVALTCVSAIGVVVGTALGWGNGATIALSIVLAFFFGYSFTFVPLLKAMGMASAAKVALAADTASITVMEIVDNLIMLVIPGAMDAGLDTALFWASLVVSLAVAAVAAFPVNRWLIARGRGHAVVHSRHHH